MTWHYPSVWFLLLLLAIAPLAWLMWARRKWLVVKFSSTQIAGSLRKTWKIRMRWLLPALRIAGLVILIVALARPQKGNEKTKIFTEGIAIEMLVDRSGSMRATDFIVDGKRVDRLTAVKDVATKFVRGEGDLPGRPNDMVGMISFARYADNASPLTLDHSYLTEKLNATEIAKTRSEDGTAIGEAIGLGVERLRTLKDRKGPGGKSRPVKSKVIILLTDGENNVGDLNPIQAAELANTMDVKIYTIGVGTRGLAQFPAVNPFTGQTQMQMMPVNIDETTLKKIAKITGGRYFRATDTDSLREIYATIDKLEKTKIDQRRFAEYRELALKPVRAGGITIPPLMLLALILLLAEGFLANTWLRRIP